MNGLAAADFILLSSFFVVRPLPDLQQLVWINVAWSLEWWSMSKFVATGQRNS